MLSLILSQEFFCDNGHSEHYSVDQNKLLSAHYQTVDYSR